MFGLMTKAHALGSSDLNRRAMDPYKKLEHTYYDAAIFDIDSVREVLLQAFLPSGKSGTEEIPVSAVSKEPDLTVNGKDWFLKDGETMDELRERAAGKRPSSAIIDDKKKKKDFSEEAESGEGIAVSATTKEDKAKEKKEKNKKLAAEKKEKKEKKKKEEKEKKKKKEEKK
jgi:hypothetical protein